MGDTRQDYIDKEARTVLADALTEANRECERLRADRDAHKLAAAEWKAASESITRTMGGQLRDALADRDRLREALTDLSHYLRGPHAEAALACGIDACIFCLAEETARFALTQVAGDGEGRADA
jgi:hypothetical protein